jgi:hypothetical protein
VSERDILLYALTEGNVAAGNVIYSDNIESSSMRVLVEATCLTWISVELETGMISDVRVHAAPENLVIPVDPDVISEDPEQEELVDQEIRQRALSIARNARRPERFDLMA